MLGRLPMTAPPPMFSPGKMVIATKKSEQEVGAADSKEKTVRTTIKKPETVGVEDLRAIFALLGGTIGFLLDKMSIIIKKLNGEVTGADIKSFTDMLELWIGTMKLFLWEKIGSIIKMPEVVGVDVKDLIFALQSFYGTMRSLLEAVGSIIKSPEYYSGVDMKNLRAAFDLLMGTMKFVGEKAMGSSVIKKPEAAIVGVEVKDLSLDGVTYNAKIAVSNPYIVPVPIGEIFYTLKTDDRVIVSGKVGKRGWMPGNAKTVLELPVRVAHTILLSLEKDIGGDGDIEYQLDLAVTLISLLLYGDVTVPLSWKGEIKNVPSLFSIF